MPSILNFFLIARSLISGSCIHQGHSLHLKNLKYLGLSVFSEAWTSAIIAVNMVSGLVATCIHHSNPEAIPKDAYLTSSQASEGVSP